MRSTALFVSLVTGLAATLADAAQPPSYPADLPLVWPATVTRAAPSKKRPWKKATVEAIVPRKLEPGQLVTVVPLARAAPSARAVATVQPQEGVPGFPTTYLITVDAAAKPLLEAKAEPGHTDERPFEALVVSPAAPKARLLNPAAVKDLPTGTGASPATLSAAVDLDADGKADAALFRYCCDQPATAPRRTDKSPCSPECQAIYLRGKDGAWQAVHQASDD
jgi:hypothetical protein